MGKNRGMALPTMGEDITGTTFEEETVGEREGYTWDDNVGENGGYLTNLDWDDISNYDDIWAFNAVTGVLMDNPDGMTIDDIYNHYSRGNDIVDIGYDSSTNYEWREEGYINQRDWDILESNLTSYLDDMEGEDIIYMDSNGRYHLNPYISNMPSSNEIMNDAMDYYSDYETYMGY